MSPNPQADHDRALAYPEPPAHPHWHRQGPKPAPITPERAAHNLRVLELALAQRTAA